MWVSIINMNKKTYWLKFAIIFGLIPVVPALISLFISPMLSFFMLGYIFGLGFPFMFDDLGYRFLGSELFVFTIPVIWFGIGAFMGYLYEKLESVKNGKKIFFSIVLIFTTIISGFCYKIYMDETYAAHNASQYLNPEFCNNMFDFLPGKESCYSSLVEGYRQASGRIDSVNCTGVSEKYINSCKSYVAKQIGDCEKVENPYYQCYAGQLENIVLGSKFNHACSDMYSGYAIQSVIDVCQLYKDKKLTIKDLCSSVTTIEEEREDCLGRLARRVN
jgi:hypothetical protein